MKKFFILFSLILLSCGAPATVAGAGGIPQPSNFDLDSASDSGLFTGDNITNDTTPTFNISNIVPGATVELLRDNVAVLTVLGTNNNMTLTEPNGPPDCVCVYKVRQTLAPNTNTSLPLTVTIDTTRPEVVINKAAGQADPAATLPMRFTAVLNEPHPNFGFVDEDFEVEDLLTSGSTVSYLFITGFSCDAAATTCNITITGNTPGIVQLSVVKNAFTDIAGNLSIGSISTDNSIDFQPVPTTMNFLGRIQKSGGRMLTLPVTVRIFDTVTDEQFTVRPNSSGYFRLNNHPFYAGTARSMTVRVYNKSGQQIYSDTFVVEGDRFLLFIIHDP